MSDPLRTDDSRALAAASEADRKAKIEQLLLTGLDHYFAAQYDHAISVWTRQRVRPKVGLRPADAVRQVGSPVNGGSVRSGSGRQRRTPF